MIGWIDSTLRLNAYVPVAITSLLLPKRVPRLLGIASRGGRRSRGSRAAGRLPTTRSQKRCRFAMCGRGNIRRWSSSSNVSRFTMLRMQWSPKVIDIQSLLANFPANAHDEQTALHDSCSRIGYPASPVCSGTDGDGGYHEDCSRRLDAHHRDTQCADGLCSECCPKLGCILNDGESSRQET